MTSRCGTPAPVVAARPNAGRKDEGRTGSCLAGSIRRKWQSCVRTFLAGPWALLALAGTLVLSGCQSPQPTALLPEDAAPDRAIALREGDVVKVVFPGSPNLNTTQQIRRDGNINLALVGDIQAAGLVPSALEKEILRVFGSQLLSPEVTVSLESTQFAIFVTGMVVRPGKVISDRPITLLEAIMESGGFDYGRANLKAIRVMRREGERMKTFIVDLKPAMAGEPNLPFHLRPSDIIFVPERFSLF